MDYKKRDLFRFIALILIIFIPIITFVLLTREDKKEPLDNQWNNIVDDSILIEDLSQWHWTIVNWEFQPSEHVLTSEQKAELDKSIAIEAEEIDKLFNESVYPYEDKKEENVLIDNSIDPKKEVEEIPYIEVDENLEVDPSELGIEIDVVKHDVDEVTLEDIQ